MAEGLVVEVVWGGGQPPQGLEVHLARGATVADAIAAAGLRQRHPAVEFARLAVGIWGRPCAPDTPVRDGDRVEVYAPLVADPKEARRRRARRGRGTQNPPVDGSVGSR